VINPGLEHDGVIHVIGEHTQGVHAELAAIPATNVVPLRDGVSFEEAAAFPLVYETAYRMLVTRGALQAGEWVLIWGIGGGVATAALRIAQALGARTIVTSSSDAKLARAAEFGADLTVNHESGDVVAAVKEATGGGVDVVWRPSARPRGSAPWMPRLRRADRRLRDDLGPNRGGATHQLW
jgi:NADPH2:quinone reductase